MTTYCEAPGVPVDLMELRLPKARDTVRAICSERLAFVTYLEARREPDGTEVVVMDVEVERGQRAVHDVRLVERIAVRFFPDDWRVPDVLALRNDFPVVPHQNILDTPLPRSLCLYDEPYDEIKLTWTAPSFVERVRTWLALTARGELHAPDQPLEPLLLDTSGVLVIPPEALSTAAPRIVLTPVESNTGRVTYIAAGEAQHPRGRRGVPCTVMVLWGKAQSHGIIQQRPRTIGELHAFLQPADINLVSHIQHELRSWRSATDFQEIRHHKLAIVVVLPKTRSAGSLPEAEDCYAFVSTMPISEIGEQVGIWQMQGDEAGLFFRPDDEQHGDSVELVLLNPMLAFSSDQAARLNGRINTTPQPIAAVGVGALGSQVVMTLARMGYAPWTLIDADILLPHNLARHALTGFAVGHAKSDCLAPLIAHMLGDPQAARSLPIDVLHPGAREDELATALSSASVILDMSASVAVARALADRHDARARRISIFLNPSATDLVVLAEDAERRILLDLLELQYYRLTHHDERLKHHLHVDGRPLRVGRSCRDVSVTLPQDLVALHAANGSRALRRLLETPTAQITVWQTDPASGAVTVINAEPQEVVVQQLGDWMLCTDRWLESQLQELRTARLPNETGGVLLGTIDCERRRIIVVDYIPSPPDSVEWPIVYIRGCRDLPQLVERCEERTAGWLTYVGEWHSHPVGVPATPSTADWQVLAWLEEARAVDGFPAIMAIVGDQGCAWYLGGN